MAEEIGKSMREIFKSYNKLISISSRGVGVNLVDAEKPEFWDVVILTTFDEAQKESFQKQIDLKKQNGHLPDVPFHVIPDPAGHKLGVGGSTLHVLAEMTKVYGSDLHLKKLLIIHSGGSSQRLPSYSVVGKIFSPVPCKELRIGSSVPQMLDLKLAMYLPFCQMLKPGVFVTCADDIETYSLETEKLDLKAIEAADVVALAHPSDVRTGEGHGVYVLEDVDSSLGFNATCVRGCAEVLQKPSESAMRSKGAVIMKEENGNIQEQIWSDSVFWFSADVYKKMLKWYNDNIPLTSELDAYAHFLPCLGSRMKAAKPSDFSDFRAEMLPLLQDCNFQLILLSESKFYHLGTMEEYLVHFNILDVFCRELDIIKNTSNCSEPIVHDSERTCKDTNKGMVIETYFSKAVPSIRVPDVSTQIVIENCHIEIPFQVEGNTIISNCVISTCPSVRFHDDGISLFKNLLYHTVPVTHQSRILYVTVAFDVTSKMKKTSKCLSDIELYGTSLSDVICYLGFKMEDVMSGKSNDISLWTARIFVGMPTAAESFWYTHHNINKVLSKVIGKPLQTDISEASTKAVFSMQDIVSSKSMETLLRDRENLKTLLRE